MRAKAEYPDQAGEQTGGAIRQIGVTRVGAADMSTERAGRTVRIVLECETVPALVRLYPSDIVFRKRNQRFPGHRAADHRLGQLPPRGTCEVGLTLEVLPEPANILLQIAEN